MDGRGRLSTRWVLAFQAVGFLVCGVLALIMSPVPRTLGYPPLVANVLIGAGLSLLLAAALWGAAAWVGR